MDVTQVQKANNALGLIADQDPYSSFELNRVSVSLVFKSTQFVIYMTYVKFAFVFASIYALV